MLNPYQKIAQSELYRLHWALRTCVSCALVCLFSLYLPTQNVLTHENKHTLGPGFTSFVAIIVKDITIGSSVINAWSCILGSVISCILCYATMWIIFCTTAPSTDYSAPSSAPILLCPLFFLSFLIQYIEIQPMGKKLGVSLVAVIILRLDRSRTPSEIWYLLIDVLFGAVCGLFGAWIPFPNSRTACSELEKRVNYSAKTIASLLDDVIIAWKSQACSGHFLMNPAIDNNTNIIQHNSNNSSNQEIIKTENKHWNKLKLIFKILRIFRKTNSINLSQDSTKTKPQMAWCNRPTPPNEYYIRLEIFKFLEEGLIALQSRYNESRFGPNRKGALSSYEDFVTLIRQLLTIISTFETRLQDMDKLQIRLQHLNILYPSEKLDDVVNTYFHIVSRPNFRRRLHEFVECIGQCIILIGETILWENKRHHRTSKSNQYLRCQWIQHLNLIPEEEDVSEDDDPIVADEWLPHKTILALSKMITARDIFDKEYFKARLVVFYGVDEEEFRDHDEHSHLHFQHSSDAIPYKSPVKWETDQITEIAMNLNSFFFLLDTTCNLLLRFWSADKLIKIIKTIPASALIHLESSHDLSDESPPTPNDMALSNTCGDLHLNEIFLSIQSHSASQNQSTSTSRLQKFLKYFSRTWYHMDLLWKDLIPAQSPLFWWICSFTQSHTNKGSSYFHLPIVPLLVRERFKNSLIVALSMVLAGLYGILVRRQLDPSLAAFSIAYLSGGFSSGINIMTCINRAAGTVVGCVFAIIVQFISSSYNTDSSNNGGWGEYGSIFNGLFIGIAVTLFQFPATYVRTYPLQSYSGTVAGFTVSVLLLNPTVHLDVIITRIIDTIIGVAIYLILELTFSVKSSELSIVQDMRDTFTGIKSRIGIFHANFKTQKDTVGQMETSISSGLFPDRLRSSSIVQRHVIRIDRLQRLRAKRQPLQLANIHPIIKRQRDLIPFIRTEPSLFRPPPFNSTILEEIIRQEEIALRSLQIMSWALIACNPDFQYDYEVILSDINRKLHPEATKVKDQIPSSEYPKQEEHSFRFLLLPLEPQLEQLLDFIVLVLNYLSLNSQALVESPHQAPLTFPCSTYCFKEHNIKNNNKGMDESRPSWEYSPLVTSNRPIEKHMILKDLSKLQRQRLDRHLHLLEESHKPNGEAASNSNASLKLKLGALLLGDLKADEISTLFTTYFAILDNIRVMYIKEREEYQRESQYFVHNHRNSSNGHLPTIDEKVDNDDVDNIESVDLLPNHVNKPFHGSTQKFPSEELVTSNQEMKLVNAVLTSITDLLHALKSLAINIGRLQMHRDLHYHQDGIHYIPID